MKKVQKVSKSKVGRVADDLQVAASPRAKTKKETPAPKSPKISETNEKTPAGFPIVGIGASAGGLAAFEAFFSGMPTDTDGYGQITTGPGMAFVLVQHLAPDHKSILTDLIRRYTRMQVFEVEDGMKVMPNCAYIIPPNRDMAFLNGTLQLMEPAAPRGQRLPIDFFFRSLAQDQHERAIGIVLSGTGSDGTLGIRAIKGEGGMVMAQNPASTEYDGMPRSAIGTGLVDYELPPAEMPAQIIAYVAHAFGKLHHTGISPLPKAENTLRKIFVLLRAQTGHDFSQYKQSTINRRIERRMAVNQIATMEAYVKHLQQTPIEVEALFRDMLIGVTSFFRDPGAFKVTENEVVPRLFAGRSADSVIRVWVPGCSTGEEAYSLAILLAERQEAMKRSYKVQVFATDIDSQAIATARAGLYPASISVDISKERLRRFFAIEQEGGSYRIHKAIRDMLVFSEQNIIKDPPFSKLDMISCRNLLIYLNGDLQKKIIPLFHYALNPGCFLFLGTSETVGEFDDLFTSHDRKQKLYQRKDDYHSAGRASLGRFLPPMTAIDVSIPREVGRVPAAKKLPLRDLTEQALLHQVVPAGALVNSRGDILYLHGRTGLFLEPAPGEAGTNNILKMAREGLKRELTTALHKAVGLKDIVHQNGLRVKTNGDFTTLHLTIHPVAAGLAESAEALLYLVILEEAPGEVTRPTKTMGDAPVGRVTPHGVKAEARIAALQQQLRAKEEYLQTANEELETSNEELKSSNEEMQSVNEELQSTNEELETSKEELQSVNEELATVNAELQTKVGDLSQANNDMNNLLAGTGIATVFVDHQLRILRFTPTAAAIINLIPSDVGRPVGHIVSNLKGYDNLIADTQAVLGSLIPQEVEVQTTEDKWFTMRIMPYRTMDNVIEGAVITFMDITEMKKTQARLSESEEQFKKLFVEAPLGIALVDSLTGQICEANTMFASIAGRTVAEIKLLSEMSITHPDDIQDDLNNMARLNTGEITGFTREKRYLHPDGSVVWINMTIAPIITKDNAQPRHLCMIENISERKLLRESIKSSEERYRSVVELASHAIVIHRNEKIVYANPAANRLFGAKSADSLIGNPILDRIHPDYHQTVMGRVQKIISEGIPMPMIELKYVKLDGTILEGEAQATRITYDGAPAVYAAIYDITERRANEEALRKANELLRLAVVVRDSHDAITVQDLDGRIIAWNPGAVRMYGWSEAEALAINVRDRIPEGHRKDALTKVRQLSEAQILESYLTQRIAKDGSIVEVSIISTALLNEAGKVYAIATTERAKGK